MSNPGVAELQSRLVETVRLYEGKLATLSVFNDALQKENTQLRGELEESRAPQSATDEEVLELKQEFTRRMAGAERDVSRLKEKNEQLRNKLTAVNSGGNSTQERLRDREEYITSLQAEGETLSRKNGELESALRKVRAAAKEQEAERGRLQARLKQQDELLSKESERYGRAVEASSKQILDLKTDYESLQQRAQEQINAALVEGAAAVKDAAEGAERRTNSTLQAAQEREGALSAEVAELRQQFEDAEQSWSHREVRLRQEVVGLEAKLRQQEAEVAEAISSASEGARPLLRQIESMAAALKAQDRVRADAEGKLLEQLREALDARQAASEAEQATKGKLNHAEKAAAAAQNAVVTATQSLAKAQHKLGLEQRKVAAMEAQLREADSQSAAATAALSTERGRHEATQQGLQERVWDAQEQVKRLSAQLDLAQRQDLLAPRRSAENAVPQTLPISTFSRAGDAGSEQPARQDSQRGVEPARAAASRANGVEDGFNHYFKSGFWDPAQPPRHTQVVRWVPEQQLDWCRADTRSELGNSRMAGVNGYEEPDQKLVALQQRVTAAEAVAERANEELLLACKRAEAVQAEAGKYRSAIEDAQALRARHDLALELLGERNERVEMLEDDIREMKDIFHSQLSSLVDELQALKSHHRSSVQDFR